MNFGCCLCRYSIDELLSESDRSTMLRVLNFHPRKSEKFGIGPQDIKVCVLHNCLMGSKFGRFTPEGIEGRPRRMASWQ